jgi:hypothetical protein
LSISGSLLLKQHLGVPHQQQGTFTVTGLRQQQRGFEEPFSLGVGAKVRVL